MQLLLVAGCFCFGIAALLVVVVRFVLGENLGSIARQAATAIKADWRYGNLKRWLLTFGAGICAIVLAAAFLVNLSKKHLAKANAAKAAVESLVLNSEVGDPAKYFDQLSGLVHRATASDSSFGDADNITIERVENGTFVVADHPDRQLGNGTGYDLGSDAQARAVPCVATIVWLSGYQIRTVSKIRVTFHAVDGSHDAYHYAEYDVELLPDASFAKKWDAPTDSALQELVARKIAVVKDTASGAHWETVPR